MKRGAGKDGKRRTYPVFWQGCPAWKAEISIRSVYEKLPELIRNPLSLQDSGYRPPTPAGVINDSHKLGVSCEESPQPAGAPLFK
jgi:hypothetical protein